MPPTFADVIFPQRSTQSFTYRVPSTWQDTLKVGHWILAPFGRTARPGFVVSFYEDSLNPAIPLSKIRELKDHLTPTPEFDLDPKMIALAEWIADYYIAPVGVCFQLIQPPQPPFKTTSRLRITELGQQALERGRLANAAKNLLGILNKKPKGLTLQTLKKNIPTGSSTLTQLKRQKWVEEVHLYSVPSRSEPPTALSERTPSDLDKKDSAKGTEPIDHPPWWKNFQRHLSQPSFGEFFTNTKGQGFTSLLVHSIQETLKQQRTVLVILPDIFQARACAHTLQEKLGINIGLYHSGMPDPLRMKEWQAIQRGRYQVVVGTRMSVFAPVPYLGLICLSYEEDSTYKDEQAPYYHAREVARERTRLSHATLLLHSPHPSLETVHRCSFTSAPNFELSQPIGQQSTIQVVDHLQMPYGVTISEEMRQGVNQALAAGGGIIIFHNRKGFSSSLVCRDCGMTGQCARCQVPMRLLTSPPHMRCPYCGKEESVPLVCPECSGSHLEPGGFGTERLEQEFRREFPEANIGRLDRNNVRTESDARVIREQFIKGSIQILVGTEMLFHGMPLSPVRFVGIPYADAGLHLPDFRSAERLYHHLQSAIQLVTHHGMEPQVVIQTRLASHHVMHAIAQQQPSIFYDHELAFREAVGYPPFIHFIQMTVSGANQVTVQEAAGRWVQTLASQLASQTSNNKSSLAMDTKILGPIATQGLRHRRLFRETILFKADDVGQAKTLIRHTYESMAADKHHKGLQFGINVDPMEMG
ncbi:replication restart helicase PriA [Candidatus Nitronereus thalassa]|uniref:Probable replication restart protein PriA n=1 Tax=Candidatus Nitronereus thalassa TaxID=3020898 RepID=A0ABU3KAD4_9BACT|nr:primosomal protein N' [Candidatus Nitronereus thalassa]MDT7043391.1 primosomal protein N' [Candidatus Nitronereus thalassa]